MRPTDRLIHPSRGNPGQAIAWARQAGARRLDQVEAFIREVYRLCDLVGLDAAILVAHSAVETGDPVRGGGWRSPAWSERLNPSGLGITDGGDLGYRFASGADAARAHVVHHHVYAKGPVPPDSPLATYVQLDPRYNVVPAAWRGAVRTIADLTGKWWTKPAGHQAIADRGNQIFPGLPDQQTETTPMPTRPYVLVVAGHRSYNDPGNPNEKALTPALARDYTEALRAAGYRADWWQRDVDRDSDPDDTVGGLDTVALGCARHLASVPGDLVLIDCHYNGAHSPLHVIVPDTSGLTTAYAGGAPVDDTYANNTLDRRVAAEIAKRIGEATGLPLYRGRAAEPGVMVEPETGVGRQGFRLAMFAATAPLRSRCVRLVIEHGGYLDAPVQRPDFTTRCAAALVAALNAVYGSSSAPPQPTPQPAVSYPEGLDEALAKRWFGTVKARDASGRTRTYSFNPAGSVSRLWLARGAETGQWPALVAVEQYDTRTYFRFADGWTVWRPNESASPKALRG